VWAFHAIRQRTGGRLLWLRNNASTVVSQLLDSAIFCTIAFWGLFPVNVFWEIMLSTYVIKVAVAALDTPFIYLARRMFRSGSVPEDEAEAGEEPVWQTARKH
jgi:uncharacterized integral membrane protein (TIGR00697 family)